MTVSINLFVEGDDNSYNPTFEVAPRQGELVNWPTDGSPSAFRQVVRAWHTRVSDTEWQYVVALGPEIGS